MAVSLSPVRQAYRLYCQLASNDPFSHSTTALVVLSTSALQCFFLNKKVNIWSETKIRHVMLSSLVESNLSWNPPLSNLFAISPLFSLSRYFLFFVFGGKSKIAFSNFHNCIGQNGKLTVPSRSSKFPEILVTDSKKSALPTWRWGEVMYSCILCNGQPSTTAYRNAHYPIRLTCYICYPNALFINHSSPHSHTIKRPHLSCLSLCTASSSFCEIFLGSSSFNIRVRYFFLGFRLIRWILIEDRQWSLRREMIR